MGRTQTSDKRKSSSPYLILLYCFIDSPTAVACVRTMQSHIRRTKFYIAAAFHARSGDQLITASALRKPAIVFGLIGALSVRYHADACAYLLEHTILCGVFGSLAKKAPLTFRHGLSDHEFNNGAWRNYSCKTISRSCKISVIAACDSVSVIEGVVIVRVSV